MSYWGDLWAVLKADGIALDETEAALLGAPEGETISLWAAMGARHGIFLACVACGVLSVLVQWGHCKKQLLGEPMPGISYLRAMVCLLAVLGGAVGAAEGLAWWLLGALS